MAEDSDLERTEDPSERRLEQAREEGQIARSRELNTFAVMMAGGAGLWLMGSALNTSMLKLLHDGLSVPRDLAFKPELLLPHLFDLASAVLLAFAPLLLLLMLVALFSPMLLDGWVFSTKALQPNFSRMNPFSGIARMFSSHGLIELVKALAKALLIGGIAAWVIWKNREVYLLLSTEAPSIAIPHLATLMWACFLAVMGGLALIAMIDVPFQLYEHHKKLKMTKEEVRQEAKESEGNPEVKGRIRSMQREMARRRMMAAIPTADVVVTNPTHFSVALKYSETGMRAPIVVAKGTHLLAARIREIATEHNVPILEAPPLARALYKHCELEQSIPEALYNAVAQVLAYVYQLRNYKQMGGAAPELPQELPVPEGMDPGAIENPSESEGG